MPQKLTTMISKSAIAFLVLVLLIVTVTSFGFQDRKSAPKFDDSQYPVYDENNPRIPTTEEERTKHERKAKRFRGDIPLVSRPDFEVVAGSYEWPQDFSPLPVCESTSIILGRVTHAEANLSDDRLAVYSDFIIQSVEAFRSTDGLTQDSSLTATRYGGKIKFQDGHTLLVFQSGLGMPRVGRQYLFFLKKTDADFEIITAYEIKQGQVIPLDSGTSVFKPYANLSESALIQQVRQKIESL